MQTSGDKLCHEQIIPAAAIFQWQWFNVKRERSINFVNFLFFLSYKIVHVMNVYIYLFIYLFSFLFVENKRLSSRGIRLSVGDEKSMEKKR